MSDVAKAGGEGLKKQWEKASQFIEKRYREISKVFKYVGRKGKFLGEKTSKFGGHYGLISSDDSLKGASTIRKIAKSKDKQQEKAFD